MSLKFLEKDLVNILASMTLNLPSYPNLFYKTGYRIEYFEKEFDISVEGDTRQVKFDLVLNNTNKNHSLPFECKSGHTEPDQLHRYSCIKSEDLVRIGGVTSSNPSSHTHDVTIVFNSENLNDIQQETMAYPFPLLSISNDPTSLAHHGKKFEDDDLQCFFDESIEYPIMIHEVFRVDGQTHLIKYILLISDALVSLSVDGKETFALSEIVQSIFSIAPGIYPERVGRQLRIAVEKKVDQALTVGSTCELKDYFFWDYKTKTGKLLKIHPGCKGSTYKDFSDMAKKLEARLRVNGPIPNEYLKKEEILRKSRGQIHLELAT